MCVCLISDTLSTSINKHGMDRGYIVMHVFEKTHLPKIEVLWHLFGFYVCHLRRRFRTRCNGSPPPGSPSVDIMAVDTRTKGVMAHDETAITRTCTGETNVISAGDRDYFPLTFPLLFVEDGASGWHVALKSTPGNRNTLAQWVF